MQDVDQQFRLCCIVCLPGHKEARSFFFIDDPNVNLVVVNTNQDYHNDEHY